MTSVTSPPLPLVPRSINMVTFVARATASSSRSDDDAMSAYISEEERQRNRCRPAATLRADGGCGRSLCPSSSPMPLTSPPPRSLTSPRKTHQQTSSYLRSETLISEFSQSGEPTLARNMHEFFAVATKPSALAALPDPQAGTPRAPRRAVQHACGALGRAAWSGRRFRRLATKTYA